MSLREQFIHLEEKLSASEALIGRYTLGMIFLFLCLEEMTRLLFGGRKILIIHDQDRMMR